MSVTKEEWINHVQDLLHIKSLLTELNKKIDASMEVLSVKLDAKIFASAAKDAMEEGQLDKAEKLIRKMEGLLGENDPEVVFCKSLLTLIKSVK